LEASKDKRPEDGIGSNFQNSFLKELPATSDNKRLAFTPFGKSASFFSYFLKKEAAGFANPNRYLLNESKE